MMPTTAMPPVITLDQLTKVFVTDEVETHALENVSLEIARGEYVSISGPSGCGKSTLLSILGLLDSPVQCYRLNGKEVSELKAGSARGSATGKSGSSSRAST